MIDDTNIQILPPSEAKQARVNNGVDVLPLDGTTLLSRTLQTLLSKYLSDVDVGLPLLYILLMVVVAVEGVRLRMSSYERVPWSSLANRKEKSPKTKEKNNTSAPSDRQEKSKKAQDKPPPTVRIGRPLTKNDDEGGGKQRSSSTKQVRNPDAKLKLQPRRRRRSLPPLPQAGFLGEHLDQRIKAGCS
jgi:hypothetical protein